MARVPPCMKHVFSVFDLYESGLGCGVLQVQSLCQQLIQQQPAWQWYRQLARSAAPSTPDVLAMYKSALQLNAAAPLLWQACFKSAHVWAFE